MSDCYARVFDGVHAAEVAATHRPNRRSQDRVGAPGWIRAAAASAASALTKGRTHAISAPDDREVATGAGGPDGATPGSKKSACARLR